MTPQKSDKIIAEYMDEELETFLINNIEFYSESLDELMKAIRKSVPIDNNCWDWSREIAVKFLTITEYAMALKESDARLTVQAAMAIAFADSIKK